MEELIDKINSKRKSVRGFMLRQEPGNRLLINVAIICGIAGTVLAGIPAIGGAAAIDGIKSVTQPQLPSGRYCVLLPHFLRLLQPLRRH